MRILAFSDWRIHSMDLVDLALDLTGEVDAIWYAGDDTRRFALPPVTDQLRYELDVKVPVDLRHFVPKAGTGFRGVWWGEAYGISVRSSKPGKDNALARLGQVFASKAFLRHVLDWNESWNLRQVLVPEPKKAEQLMRLSQSFWGRRNDEEWHLREVARLLPRSSRTLKVLASSFQYGEYGGVAVFLEAKPTENQFERFAKRARLGLGAVVGNDCEPTSHIGLRAPGVTDLHREPMLLGPYGVIGLEGAPGGSFGWVTYPEAQATRHLERAAARYPKDTPLVVVSHSPPHGVLDYSVRFGAEHIGSRALAKFIRTRNVRLVVCGHSHLSGGGVSTVGQCLVVNAANHDSAQSQARFAVIDLNDSPSVPPSVSWLQPENETVRALHLCGPVWTERFFEKGIRFHRQLLGTTPEELSERMGAPYGNAVRWVCHAEALSSKRFVPLRERGITFPEECIYYDLETLPFNSLEEQIWLIGFRVGRHGKVRQFLAKNRAGEREILSKFLDFLGKHPNLPLACYAGSSNFDHAYLSARVWSRLPKRLPELESHPTLNVLTYMQRYALPPSPGYALKAVAQALGMVDGSGIDGLAAGLAYEEWRTRRVRPNWSGLLAYNAQDVDLMTRVLCTFEEQVPMEPSVVYERNSLGPNWRTSPG